MTAEQGQEGTFHCQCASPMLLASLCHAKCADAPTVLMPQSPCMGHLLIAHKSWLRWVGHYRDHTVVLLGTHGVFDDLQRPTVAWPSG